MTIKNNSNPNSTAQFATVKPSYTFMQLLSIYGAPTCTPLATMVHHPAAIEVVVNGGRQWWSSPVTVTSGGHWLWSLVVVSWCLSLVVVAGGLL